MQGTGGAGIVIKGRAAGRNTTSVVETSGTETGWCKTLFSGDANCCSGTLELTTLSAIGHLLGLNLVLI